MCMNKLNMLSYERDQRWKQAIDTHRSTMERRFFHKLFKKPTPTDEEVERDMYRNGFSELVFITVWYDKRAPRVRLIKEAALALLAINPPAECYVYLSVDDYDLINPGV